MKIITRCFLSLLFLLVLASQAHATHIVGGSLTYVHNGGSNYTITLKLYRDCGPGTANFPGAVNVVVRGANGATFSPTRNVTMSLNSVTSVPSTLDPCADPPSPLPCVEEGIYTKTVNNLPPNPGGYHMYFQIIARNLGIVNIDATCNCIGETFYAYIPGPPAIWVEEFGLPNGTTIDNGTTAWSINNGTPTPSDSRVNNNRFEFRGSNNAEGAWESEVINIAAFPSGVNLSIDLLEAGTFENSDTIYSYYRLNGGPLTQFNTNGFIKNDFGNAVASQTTLIGTTIQIVVHVRYGGNSPSNERYRFDNVSVFGTDFIANSNPEFTQLPPLFLCAGQPFSFDHSAFDLDGDSLVYSFYTPYDGDNGAGPLDPTYVGNIAIFTPVTWEPGFSATNPLGGAPLNLNSSTGLLTGTPTMIGQFVVGVKVDEYRNGVKISETLRDLQINVVNCPQPNPPVAGNDIIINDGCMDTLTATGFVDASVTWTSIFPGSPGDYDNYLSCTAGCVDPIVASIGTPPAFIDFVICGTALSCNGAFICDTVRVTFNPTLAVSIIPANPVICFGQTSTLLTANGIGGTPPYSYLWNNVNPSQSINVGAGTFTVALSDSSGCPPALISVTVVAYAVPVNADAGLDDTVCIQNPVVTLNGVVTGTSGGIWSNGNGTFSPNDSTLTGVNYTPTVGELAAGFVDLILTTTGNVSCPPDADTVHITFLDFIGTVTTATTDITCFGLADGTAWPTVTGGIGPFTYLWNSVPSQAIDTATNLGLGTYDLTIQNSIGCTTLTSVTISQPLPLNGSSTHTDVSCYEGSDGSITVVPTGGTAPYSFLWTPGLQTSASITGQLAGNYSVLITDSNGCSIDLYDTIVEPTPLVISMSQINVT